MLTWASKGRYYRADVRPASKNGVVRSVWFVSIDHGTPIAAFVADADGDGDPKELHARLQEVADT